jgi:hypothetical protein
MHISFVFLIKTKADRHKCFLSSVSIIDVGSNVVIITVYFLDMTETCNLNIYMSKKVETEPIYCLLDNFFRRTTRFLLFVFQLLLHLCKIFSI